jgi:hypothetical protein
MALGAHELSQIDAALAEPAGGAPAAELRRRLPGLTVTQCDASDVGVEAPFRVYSAYDLHLIDGRDHCWRLTADPACATGVMIARRGAER